jgi:hypothetical protein
MLWEPASSQPHIDGGHLLPDGEVELSEPKGVIVTSQQTLVTTGQPNGFQRYRGWIISVEQRRWPNLHRPAKMFIGCPSP